jgi:hypothetical protein
MRPFVIGLEILFPLETEEMVHLLEEGLPASGNALKAKKRTPMAKSSCRRELEGKGV